MKFATMTSLTILGAALLASTTTAESGFELNFPNGAFYGITLGHPGGDSAARNEFAELYFQGWAVLCPLDTDGDGYTNGQEMGDPDCVWTPDGGVDPTTTDEALLSDPNDATSIPAGAVDATSSGSGTEVTEPVETTTEEPETVIAVTTTSTTPETETATTETTPETETTTTTETTTETETTPDGTEETSTNLRCEPVY